MLHISRMKLAAIRLYHEFLDRRAAQAQQDHKRYLALAEFIEEPQSSAPPATSPAPAAPAAPATPKTAAAEGLSPGTDEDSREPSTLQTERELEQRKQERLVGGHGMQEAFQQQFLDVLEPYLPVWDEATQSIAKDFYPMMQKGIRDLFPGLIAQRVNQTILKTLPEDEREEAKKGRGPSDQTVSGISKSDVDINNDLINQIVTDALIHFHEHPEEIRDGLIRSYTKKKIKDDEGDKKEFPGLSMTEAFFTPRPETGAFKETIKDPGATGDEPAQTRSRVDHDALDSLHDGTTIRWKWLGIDEGHVLHFSLPDLYADREFTVRLPEGIKNIHPGEYTFKVKKVKRNGAIIDFVEQSEDMWDRHAEAINRTGLGRDQLRAFINNGVINRYITILRRMPIEELLEKFAGKVTVRGGEIGSVDDLAELAEDVLETPKVRGEEKIEEARQKLEEEEQNKIQRVVDRWAQSPDLQQMHLQMTSSEGRHISDVISRQFPEESTKGTISLGSILATRPVVSIVLDIIMDPTTPMGGKGKAEPWITLAIKAIHRAALQDPVLQKQFTEFMRLSSNKKSGTPGTPAVPGAPAAPVSTADLNKFILSIPESSWRKSLTEKDLKKGKGLQEKIREVMLKLKGDPALARFFDRRKKFNEYIRRDLEDEVMRVIQMEHLDPTQAKDMEALDKFMQSFVNKRVKQMQQPGLSAEASFDDPTLHYLLKRAYRILTAKK